MSTSDLKRGLATAAVGLAISMLVLPDARAAVGRTEAAYGVTQNGTPTYSVPIRATDGINGLTPRLAINYAGPGTRSIFGVGFALSGLSYITPCRKTIAQDLNAAPVTLTSADRYCLDGARLRSILGTYGATNSQYRTELDQLVRVTSLASTNNVPGSFRVEMPDGLQYDYGGTTDSKLMSGVGAGATPQFWALNKISDSNGNSIRFVYDTDAATRRFRPNYISYTERGGMGHYKISFVYQPAPLPFLMQKFTPSLQGGAAHEQDRLLGRIDLEYDDVVYRTYKLIYQGGAGDNQRLQKVQECAAGPPEDCLPETVLSWLSATEGHDALASSGKSVASGVLPLDINGDAIVDLVWASGGTWRYMLGGAAGFGAIVNTSVAATNPSKAMLLEWNGDGFEDLLIDWSDGKWRVLRGGANGFNTTVVHAGPGGIPSNSPSTSWTVSDIDGDGRDDLLSMPLNSVLAINARHNGSAGFGAITQLYSSSLYYVKDRGFISSNGASSVRRPDFNGDSRSDLLVYVCFWEAEPPGGCITTYRWNVLMSEGASFVFEGAIPGASLSIGARFGDFNADGLTDIVYPQASIWTIGLGQGSGTFEIENGPSSAGYATYQMAVGDYDGDGYDDLYVARNSPFQWEVFRSTGTGLATTAIPTNISGTGLGWMLVDQNGDSLPDLGRYTSAASPVWHVADHKGVAGDHLRTALDGMGNLLRFSYLPMTDPSIYTKGTGAVFPERDFKGSRPLVRTQELDVAGGGDYAITYEYANARVHGQGRSFLGMGRREFTDGRNNVFTIETYRQDFPYVGAPATVTVKQSSAGSAKTIQSATHTYNHHVLSSASGNQRYLPYRSKTVTNAYEVGGTRNGDHITQVTETHTVNTWGNSTFASIDVKDMDALSSEIGSIYRTEVTSTFIQDSTDWCIALPLTRSEKRILPDGSNEFRDVGRVIDPAACRVTQETVEPGGSSFVSLVTDIGYNGCGIVSSVSSYPVGQTAEARTTSFIYGSHCQRPTKITNPEGHETLFAYNQPLAIPSQHTDPNGVETDFEYDGFGRLTRELRPDGTAARFVLTACSAGNGWCGKNNGARVKVTRTERSTTDAVLRADEQFLDGVGRLRWTHSDSLESGPAIVETLYDILDRPTERTQPYFVGGVVYSIDYAHDLIGRVTSINEPISEGATSGRITGFAYEGRNLEMTDPKGFTTTRRSNALGQIRAVIDPSPGGTTNYAYHPFGEIKSITDAAGNVTSWSYNVRGFAVGTTDPDSGNWTYQVNAFGETTRIRDAKIASPNWTTRFEYDKLSRPIERSEAEGVTDFVWGSASDNTATEKYIGRLKSVSMPAYSEAYKFDQLGRLKQFGTLFDGSGWYFKYAYAPTTGLLETLTYPLSGSATPFQITNEYQNNILKRVKNVAGSPVYWEAASTDAWGRVQDETLGNGVTAFADFDQASGLMDTREAWLGATNLINANVDWDLNGNLIRRADLQQSPSVTEDIVYDNLNRFDSSDLNGALNANVTLNAIGNIIKKDSLDYFYSGAQSGCSYYAHAQPRAVRKIGTTIYCYDANGNMVKRGGSNIAYTSYNLPSIINSGSNSSSISYGAFRNRYKQIAVSGGAAETTIYVAGLFERVTRPNGTLEYRHQIPAGNGIAAIHTRINNVGTTYYVQSDHLGSPELITNLSGAEVVRLSFAAYGARRDRDWNGPVSGPDLTAISNTTRSGFTGHEHLDSVGLVHMNGRVYDPVAGRFLGVDPILAVGLSQDVNSYSYAWNDPLNVTDPSGLSERSGPVVVSCMADFCRWAPRGNRPAGPNWIGPYGHPNSAPPKPQWSGDSEFAGIRLTMFGVDNSDADGEAFLTPEQWASLRENAYYYGAKTVEFAGYVLIAFDAFNTLSGVLAGPDTSLVGFPLLGAAATLRSLAAKSASKVADAARKIEDWLGPGARAIKNDAGDLIMLSRDGARRVRFDVNRPYPHQSPHGHVEEFVNGRWVKSGPVFPKNVTPE